MGTIRVFYPEQFRGKFDALADHREVARFAISDERAVKTDLHLTICEEIYRAMNVVNGTEINMALELRSMSMGDIIQFQSDEGDEVSYYCDVVGWTEVKTPIGGWALAVTLV